MTPYTTKAEYREQVISEYRGNPLIEALPDIWSSDKVVQMLSEKAAYNNGERELEIQYRMHCIYRLFRYFQPLEQHITDYFQKYAKGGYSLDMLLIIMTQLVRQFQIGILVIDEIQHLSEAKGGGSDKMLNFFVALVNTIGLPVVMIGTTKAMSILQGEFRQARRGSGQGDLIWDRMKNDTAWQVFVKPMWRYQWTGSSVPYTDEMVNTLYDESQGIIDIAKRLAGKVIASHKNPVSVGEAFKEAYRLYISEVPDRLETEASEDDLRKSGDYEDMKRKGLVDGMEW